MTDAENAARRCHDDDNDDDDDDYEDDVSLVILRTLLLLLLLLLFTTSHCRHFYLFHEKFALIYVVYVCSSIYGESLTLRVSFTEFFVTE